MNRRDMLKTAAVAAALPARLLAGETVPRRARVTFGGDTLLGGYYHGETGTQYRICKTIDEIKAAEGIEAVAAHFFSEVGPLFRESDYNMVNFEGPMSPRSTPGAIGAKMFDKPAPLRQHEDAGRVLQAAGIKLVSLANNHMYDYNLQEGMRYTLANIGLPLVGGGEEPDAYAPRMEVINGIRIAFFGASTVLHPPLSIAEPGKPGVAGLPKVPSRGVRGWDPFVAALARARAEADFVVLMLHWGQSEGRAIDRDQRFLSNWLGDNEVDVVIGGHAHCVQETRQVGNALVFFGIGNLIFGGRQGPQSPALIPVIDFSIGPDGRRVVYQSVGIRPHAAGDFVPRLA